MPEYDLLFAVMYESVVSALDALEKMNVGTAKDILTSAQQQGRRACLSSAGYDPATTYITPSAVISEERRRQGRSTNISPTTTAAAAKRGKKQPNAKADKR